MNSFVLYSILLMALATVLSSSTTDAHVVISSSAAQPSRTSYYDGYVQPARPVPFEKRGRCPYVGFKICANNHHHGNCYNDSNCGGSMKCCNDGCGRVCKYPRFI